MEFTKQQLAYEVQSTLQGTCTYSDWQSAVKNALFNLLAGQKEGWWSVVTEIEQECEQLEQHALELLETDDYFENLIAGSGFGLCESCGWWCEDIEFDGVCSDCYEEEE